MRPKLIIALLLVLIALPSASPQTTSTSTVALTPTPTKFDGVSGIFMPGSSLTISGTGLKSPKVVLRSLSDGSKAPIDLSGTSKDDKAFTITLPPTLDPGSYYFTFADQVIPGSIDVEPNKLTLSSVHPTTAYHGETGSFDFDVIGDGFSLNPKDDQILIDDYNINPKPVTSKDKCPVATTCILAEDDHHTIHIYNYRPDRHQGVVNVGLRVGNTTAQGTQKLVFARVSSGVIFILSVVFTALLFWLVTTVVRRGLANKRLGQRRLKLLEIFIFDPETNTYSLSKFQLLLFSLTFIFGYLYVLLSRLLVQWQFVLPDVPNTIAGLLGISGGTAVASAGLTSARGAKGAGLQQPTGADLISSGGVVAPERFQFFVWTIVACAGFTALLVDQDPAMVNKFPDIPQGLLYIMGISAAGYLGGKAARKPGPVIELIGVQSRTSSPTLFILTVQGKNLDSKGRFFVDEKELGFVSPENRKVYNIKPEQKLVEPTIAAGAADPDFANQLIITITDPRIDLSKGDHIFRIVNRDGQFADYSFTAAPPQIKSIYSKDQEPSDPSKRTLKQLPAGDTEQTAVIRGANFSDGSSVTWKGQGDANFGDPINAKLTEADGTALEVLLIPGKPGVGLLNIITPTGYVTGAMVNVGDLSAETKAEAPKPDKPQGPTPENSNVPEPSGPAGSGAPAAGAGAGSPG
jgi:hypothetical protein